LHGVKKSVLGCKIEKQPMMLQKLTIVNFCGANVPLEALSFLFKNLIYSKFSILKKILIFKKNKI
jgi:hypothetical protein